MNPDDLQRILTRIAVPTLWILLSAYSWKQARKKNRSPWPWFLAALLLNPLIVLLILYFVPEGKFTTERRQSERANERWLGIVVISACVILLVVSALFWLNARREKCDAAISRFTADVNLTVDSMQAIGNVRSAASTDTIEGYIQMYRSLEIKVAQGRATLARLRAEIPRCGDFQSRVGNFEFILNNFDERYAVSSREIEVAKSIESSPANEREKRWRSELVPLIDQEASLEKQLQTIK
jgi:hypothetical protein